MASIIKVDKIAQASGTPEFTIPTADGTAKSALITDGSGVLSFATGTPSSSNFLRGDGSWQTVTTTALTGSTNTWIPTITGANALTGTANFTYDGNILDVKNSGTASSIKLYCESSNAHAQEIKAAPHAGSSAWTLTLPGTVPTVSGQSLTATTAGVASWATVGITDCSIWRLTTTFTGDANPIDANLEEDDGPDYVRLGAAMTQAAGVFTFPSTGFWRIDFAARCKNIAANNHVDCSISSVISGTSDTRSNGTMGFSSFNYATAYCSTLFDVSNTTTHKIRFDVNHTNTANGVDGDTNNNQTYMVFTRLTDT